MNVLLVALGGAVGAVSRYGLGGLVHRYASPYFPYGTFAVNVLGCLVFGVLAGLSEQRFVLGPQARAFLLLGILGGFTTFSSFTFESFQLLRDGELARAFVNIAGQVAIALGALWAGFVLARVS